MISRGLSLPERDGRLERYIPLVRPIAVRIRYSAAGVDVDELVAVGLLALLDIVESVDEQAFTPAQCVVWVKARVRGVMLRHLATEYRHDGLELTEGAAWADPAPLDGLVVREALDALPADERAVVEAWAAGNTAAETALELDRSTRWVEKKLAAGRKNLRSRAGFGLEDAIYQQTVAKRTAKTPAIDSSPTGELAALVDEFGTLDALKRSWEPQLRRHTELATTLRERAGESPPDQPVLLRGRRYHVILSPQELRRTITDMPGILAAIGQETFVKLCSFTLDKLDLLLPPAQRNQFLTSGRTGPRTLTVAAVE